MTGYLILLLFLKICKLRRMKQKIFLVICIIAVSLAQATHPNAGQGEFAFVERFNSAKDMSLAGGGIAAADNIEALFINPAGLMKIPGYSTSYLSYDYTTTEEHQTILSYGISLNALYIAMTIGFSNNGYVEERDALGNLTGIEHNPHNTMPMLTIAGALSDNIWWGTNLKLISETLAQTDDAQQALGWAVDLSLLYQPKVKNLSLALGLYNFGRKEKAHIENGEEGGYLNGYAKVGMAYIIPNFSKLKVLWDIEKPIYDYTRTILGFELSLSKSFQLRIGMKRDVYQIKKFFQTAFGSDPDTYNGGGWSAFNAGLALNLKRVNMSYGVEFLRYGMGANHRIALELPFR